MGFLDALFGRQKPVPVGPERLFAMSTAQITLETEQRLAPAGGAAICFKRIASAPFAALQADLQQLLQLTSKDAQLTLRTIEDDLGYQWFIFSGSDFQALVTTLHVASQTLIEKGYDSQLLFAIFAFKDAESRPVYWVYNYKRGTFYPFVPRPDSHSPLKQRDNAEEMRLATTLDKELPMEKELGFWYAVWDLPL
jgi:PspAB-like protein